MLTRNLRTRDRDLAGRTCSPYNLARTGRAGHGFIVFYKKRGALERGTKDRSSPPPKVARNNRALEIASQIEAMSVEQVRELYHDLIDKSPDLSASERFKLERIRARLDAEDFDGDLEARNREWERRRNEVLDSIEDLLDRLRESHLG